MTKEEIIATDCINDCHKWSNIELRAIHRFMDEYGKRQAIEYTKWMDINAVRNGEDVWLCRASGFKTNLTSEQLYDLFIEQQNKDNG